MKIFFLTELLSPYRIEWMNMLSEENSVTAYYLSSAEQTRDDRWLADKKPHFETKPVKRSALSGRLASREFLSKVNSGGFDIYIIDGYSSPIKLKVIKALLRQNRKVFINIDGIDVWRKRRALDFIRDSVKKRTFRSGAYFLCGSEIAADAAIKYGAEKEKVFVHPFTSLHRSDIIRYTQKAGLQRESKLRLGRETQKVVLAVGRFIPLKRYDVLIKAWKNMPADCFLYIIGGGSERKSYEDLMARLGINNAELLDFMLPKQLEEYFCAADLFVHTSETETWGLVFNEAMAKACPVIGTNRCVGAVELIENGVEGYVTEVGDEKALHAAMTKILSDGELRQRMMKNASEKIRNFTYENLTARHLEIFSKALGQK